jgi:hypothetical protein
MKSIVFRPLRLVKKSSKIVVASYAQWNRVRTADYGAFCLTVDNEYATMPLDAQVHDHAGQPLFWKDYDPAAIPVYTPEELRIYEIEIADLFQRTPHHGIQWSPDAVTHYCVRGLDCQGTPTFSHLTIGWVAEHYRDYADFEPLTVGTVVKWLGWFLYQLRNSSLQIGK